MPTSPLVVSFGQQFARLAVGEEPPLDPDTTVATLAVEEDFFRAGPEILAAAEDDLFEGRILDDERRADEDGPFEVQDVEPPVAQGEWEPEACPLA